MAENNLTPKEQYIFTLRELYSKFGYIPYHMGKFEEYDLYSRNKDFLISDSVITFTDTNGKLMALKPDVTLSIIKNNRALSGRTEKLFYNENVYRVAKGTNTFKEIMQAGVECIGDIDSYSIGECLYLAAESLACYRPEELFVLNVSSLDILMSTVRKITEDRGIQNEIIRCVSEKNPHEILSICKENEIDPALSEPLMKLLSLYGKAQTVLPEIKKLCDSIGESQKAEELSRVISVFEGSGLYEHINIDFSVVSDHNYYNGIIFKGYVPNVPGAVLSGGQYDKLMLKMHRKSRAIGFAVYLDMFDYGEENRYDVDILLLYDESVKLSALREEMEKLSQDGKTVRALKRDDEKLRYRQLIKLDASGEKE
ncbi:MAG: ATP phosphoribosyltransferase regulatory subunit [Ruminococcus sp.]|nr:ATP phosphoribosyltransferase regulatory subunit [Ruminococcus sp.]